MCRLLHLGHSETDLFFRGAAGVQDPVLGAVAQDQDPVAEFQQHVQVLAHVDHGRSGRLLLSEQPVDRIRGVDIHAAASVDAAPCMI